MIESSVSVDVALRGCRGYERHRCELWSRSGSRHRGAVVAGAAGVDDDARDGEGGSGGEPSGSWQSGYGSAHVA